MHQGKTYALGDLSFGFLEPAALPENRRADKARTAPWIVEMRSRTDAYKDRLYFFYSNRQFFFNPVVAADKPHVYVWGDPDSSIRFMTRTYTDQDIGSRPQAPQEGVMECRSLEEARQLADQLYAASAPQKGRA